MANRLAVGETGICPHCGKGVQFLASASGSHPAGAVMQGAAQPAPANTPNGWYADPKLPDDKMEIVTLDCPLCKRPIVALQRYKGRVDHLVNLNPPRLIHNFAWAGSEFIWPAAGFRKPMPGGVPENIAGDYFEAAIVLPHSEKASAALSRRCLQALLREAARTNSKDLADQIEEVLPALPGYVQQQLDAVRNIGNFATHEQKSKATGEIIDVEPGEAEWNLDVLDLLFDFYYQQPKIAQEKRDALNKKLAAAGKPPMK